MGLTGLSRPLCPPPAWKTRRKPAAETLVPYWVPQNQNWVATGGRQYHDITARATYAPIWTEDRLLHFGASARYHRPGDSTAANDDRVLTPGANTYMESNILKENLLGTPDLSCERIRRVSWAWRPA